MTAAVTFTLLGVAFLLWLGGKRLAGLTGAFIAFGHWLGTLSTSAVWNLKDSNMPTWAEMGGDARQNLLMAGVLGVAIIIAVSLFESKKD